MSLVVVAEIIAASVFVVAHDDDDDDDADVVCSFIHFIICGLVSNLF